MTQLASRKTMPCCKVNLPLDLLAGYSLIMHCEDYPSIEMLKVSCPRCRTVMFSFSLTEIGLFRKFGAIDVVDDDAAESLATLFRTQFDQEPLKLRWLGFNQRLELQKFHRILENIQTVEQLEVA